MQIVYHVGACCTEGERLLRSLLKNADALAAEGIRVPGPGRYRRLIRETIQNLDGRDPEQETRDILIDAILDDAPAERLVMVHSDFVCVPNRVFEGGVFYGLAEFKLASLARLFPQDTLEIHLALRNPATFVPAVFEEAKAPDLDAFLRGVDPRAISWADLLGRIRALLPAARITAWCNEDAPLIWPDLIRALSGVDQHTRILGGFDLLSTIMSEQGMRRFLSYLQSHPPRTEPQKRRVTAAFLDKYALPEAVEEELDLPGWDAALVADLTARYDADVDRIAGMDGVRLIAP